MAESWYVTVSGQSGRKFVVCDRVESTEEFVGFFNDGDSTPILLVSRRDLSLLERYVEPPY